MPKEVNLTPREKETFELILQGLSVQEIADKLIVAWSTANTLVGNVMRKYEKHSRVQLCALKITELNKQIKKLEEQLREFQCH